MANPITLLRFSWLFLPVGKAYHAASAWPLHDAPLPDQVGRAVAVNRDRRLRRLAGSHGWKVLDAGSLEPVMAGESAPSLAG